MHQQHLCPQRRFIWDSLTDIYTQCLVAAPKAPVSLSLSLCFSPAQCKAEWSLTFQTSFVHSYFIRIFCSRWIWGGALSVLLSFFIFLSLLYLCFPQHLKWIMDLGLAGDFPHLIKSIGFVRSQQMLAIGILYLTSRLHSLPKPHIDSLWN